MGNQTQEALVSHWSLARRPGVQAVFQFIPKVFRGVEVRPLFRPLMFMHANLGIPCFHGPRLCAQGHCYAETCFTCLGFLVPLKRKCNAMAYIDMLYKCAYNSVVTVWVWWSAIHKLLAMNYTAPLRHILYIRNVLKHCYYSRFPSFLYSSPNNTLEGEMAKNNLSQSVMYQCLIQSVFLPHTQQSWDKFWIHHDPKQENFTWQ